MYQLTCSGSIYRPTQTFSQSYDTVPLVLCTFPEQIFYIYSETRRAHYKEEKDMYKTTFAFRDGNDILFRFEDYYEARSSLLTHGTIFDGELLYAAITYCGREVCYTTDLIDWRFGCDGMIISLGDHISIRSTEYPSEPLAGSIEKINPADGKVLVSVFDKDNGDIWFCIESFL